MAVFVSFRLFIVPMEVVKEPENPLESCLRLLKGEKDEQKIAGLLLASKHLKPSVCMTNDCVMV